MRADELNRLLTTERQQLEGELLATGTGTEQGRKIQEQIALIDESLRRLPQMSRLTTTELKTTLEQLGIQVPPPVPSKGEFTLYPTQGALSAQAQSFLTYTTTVIGLYVSVTGATWVVASSDTLGVGSSTICFLLWLHIFLSVGVSVSIWGAANNFIQRLNLTRWLGETSWPNLEKLGGREYSWAGVPTLDLVSGQLKVLSYRKWFEKKKLWWENANGVRWLPRIVTHIYLWPGFYIRYRAWTWPSLRHQRLWAILPLGACIVTGILLCQTSNNSEIQQVICAQAASDFYAEPINRGALERAKFLFDRAHCDVMSLDTKKYHPRVQLPAVLAE